MTEREAFEAWAKEKLGQGYSLLIEEGVYFDKVTRWAFKAWKASRQQALEEINAACRELLQLSARQARDGDHFEIGRESGHQECIDAIRSLTTTGDKA